MQWSDILTYISLITKFIPPTPPPLPPLHSYNRIQLKFSLLNNTEQNIPVSIKNEIILHLNYF